MAAYSIGEVEQLTGIKPYVLRYWEEVIPCFAPKKDIGGRRSYSQRDVDIILRLKYLIYEKRYTIDGARSQIIQETATADGNAAALQALHDIREELGSLYLMLKKSAPKNKEDTASLEKSSQENITNEKSEKN
ncbi:MAG: MerR family transcriptional regulator [Treponema sp.]